MKKAPWLSGNLIKDITEALILNQGLSRNDLNNYFNRNISSVKLKECLNYLLSIDKIEIWKEKTRGRTKTIIYLK
mgnify:CR=1 FL=1